MSFIKYQAYKASGIAWLGNVPADWNVLPLKVVATCNDEILPEGTNGDTAIEYVEISGVEEGRGITQTEPLTFASAPSRARRVVRHGDVLISTVRTYLRAIATVSNPAENLIASTGFAAIRPKTVHPGFLGYLLHCEYLISEVIARSVGISYPAINASDLMRLKGPIPQLEEQAAIATFLDLETAKIDVLVEKQRSLIELLKEKRHAVILQAVTKGLDSNVAMKGSGVEWLGKVPQAWTVRSLRTLSSVVRGASPRPAGDPQFFNGDHLPWVTVAEITKDALTDLTETEACLTVAGAGHSRLFRSGTVIYSNSGATLGVPKILQIDACANDGVVGFECLSDLVVPIFLYHYLSSLTTTIRDMVKQGSGQPNLNTGLVKAIPIALPSRQEQLAICSHIQELTMQFDRLSTEAEKAMKLLQERRSALISAAVTGQIDVRGLVPQTEAVAA